MDTAIEQLLKKTFPSLNQDLRLLREMLNDVEEVQNQSNDNSIIPDL